MPRRFFWVAGSSQGARGLAAPERPYRGSHDGLKGRQDGGEKSYRGCSILLRLTSPLKSEPEGSCL